MPTIGCRRAGGGLAGGVAVSNVAEGARLAAELRPDLVLFDGSGSAIPPVATARRVLVTGSADRDPYLDTYRRLVSDLVVYQSQLDNGSIAEYRNVREVDGSPINDRQERVETFLLSQAKAGSLRNSRSGSKQARVLAMLARPPSEIRRADPEHLGGPA